MRLVILDPNLVDTHGHHALYNRLLAGEVVARGCEAVILGNRRFVGSRLDGTDVFPLLETTAYAQVSDDPVFGPYENAEAGNDAVFAEMSELPSDFFRRSDLVVAHTVSHITLLGLINWIATLPPTSSPCFCILLMLPSGLAVDEDGAPTELFDPAAAQVYQKAFRRVREKDLDVTFMASGAQHAKQFSALFGEDIPSHALLTAFDASPVECQPDPKRTLLYAGDAKMNKGLGALPDLISAICPLNLDMVFHIHANPGPAWGPALDVVAALREMAPNHQNLDLELSALDGPTYGGLLASSGIILLPYDADEYRYKSSGVVWEAICSESHLVVPAGTWLEAECRYWGAAFETYEYTEPAAKAAALAQAIENFEARRADAVAAARRFGFRNGIKALVDQLADLWVSRPASLTSSEQPRMHAQPLGLNLNAEVLSGDGWRELEYYQGAPARWTGAQVEMEVSAPAIGNWALSFRGPFYNSVSQLWRTRLEVDGSEIPLRVEWRKDGGWVLTGVLWESRADRPARRVSLIVDSARLKPPENRELGLLVSSFELYEAPLSLLEVANKDATPQDDGWTAALRHGRWRSKGPPPIGAVLAFEISEDLSEAGARQVEVLINGKPQRLRFARDLKWSAQADPGPLEGMIDCEIILPERARVKMLGFVAGPEEHAIYDAPSLPVSTGAVKDSMDAPTRAKAAMTSHWDCAALENFETVSICNLHVSGFSHGKRQFDDFYLKLLCGEGYVALELSEQDGAFQILDAPDPEVVRNTEWGASVTIFASPEGELKDLEIDRLARNSGPLMQLLKELPEGVRSSGLSGDEMQKWSSVANTMARLATVTD